MQRTQRDGACTDVTVGTSIAAVAVGSVCDSASIVQQHFARVLPVQHNLALQLLLQRSEAVRRSSLGRAAMCAARPMQSQPRDVVGRLVDATVQQQQQCSDKVSAVQASGHGGLGTVLFVLHSPLAGGGL